MSRKISTGKIITILAALITVAALSFGFISLKERFFPPPLSLPPGVEIMAEWRLEEEGPFHIGDLIPIRLEVEGVSALQPRLLPLTVADLGGLELVREEAPVSGRRKGGWQRSVRYLLSPWQVGTFRLPAKEVHYHKNSGASGTITTEPLELTVASLLPTDLKAEDLATLELKGDKGPVGLPPDYRRLGLLLAGGALLTLLVFFIWRLARNGRKKDILLSQEASVPQAPAHLLARRRLAALQQAGFLENGLFKAYYSELSACLREYLEKRFALPALEMTTPEILSSAKTVTLLTEARQAMLAEVLNTSDLVKFAKHHPTSEAATGAFEQVRAFIEETKEEPADWGGEEKEVESADDIEKREKEDPASRKAGEKEKEELMV